jgi:regulator of protease activity HflC (stomatin/prohibitin superfamily)
MIAFVAVLGALVGVTVLVQLLTNMKIVGGNELGVVTGSGGDKGFRTLSGGRAFIIPLLQRFSKFDLTPITIEVVVDSAIAAGIVPLNVKATVSFAIAGNEAGRSHAVTRILDLAADRDNLTRIAGDIIEGHLRDSIASMTPEQVMKDKDTLVAKMINVCKHDLENIGLEITTMNIADVDDHRLPGVEEPDLYMALLKRIQSANAETKARQAQAEARAASAEQAEARRAWLLDNFEGLFEPFAATLGLYPAGRLAVLTGSGGERRPLSAIHPDAVSQARNELAAAALEGLTAPPPAKGIVDTG